MEHFSKIDLDFDMNKDDAIWLMNIFYQNIERNERNPPNLTFNFYLEQNTILFFSFDYKNCTICSNQDVNEENFSEEPKLKKIKLD